MGEKPGFHNLVGLQSKFLIVPGGRSGQSGPYCFRKAIEETLPFKRFLGIAGEFLDVQQDVGRLLIKDGLLGRGEFDEFDMLLSCR